jgi:methylated-DNA-[protein]-cysteine S-methyltransferase
MNTHDNLIRDLELAYTHDENDLSRLHTRLIEAAQSDGILDVSYRTVDSPVGTLLLAATELGVVRVAYENENHDVVLQNLADRISPRILEAPARLDVITRELDQYFAGHLRTFEAPLDRRLSSGFRRTVLDHLSDIDYGHTATYAAVAKLSGRPNAVRAVGTACATNPLPVVVPCHRVLRSDGTLGGYLGGVDAKRLLLTLESAA